MNTQKQKPFTLVVGVDFTPLSDAALLAAHNLAERFPGAKVHAVHVVAPPYGEEWEPLDVQRLERDTLDRVRNHVAILDLPPTIVPHAVVGSPLTALPHVAGVLHADLLVLGTHGRKGIARAVLGSVAEAVTRHAPCSVLAVRAREVGAEEGIEPSRPGQDPKEHHARARKHYEGPNEALQGFGMGALTLRP